MQFVINTNYKAAGTKVCVDDLIPRLRQAGHVVTQNDWDHYDRYDVALFMAPDSAVATAKAANARLKVGIMDPKLTLPRQREESRAADFLVVSSLEQREAFLPFHREVIIYYMFPEVPAREKRHVNQSNQPIRIVYHGNKQHLQCMEAVSEALDELSLVYPIEFHPIYNIRALGQWKFKRPKQCKVVDTQWTEDTFHDAVAAGDIGILPSLIPLPRWQSTRLARFLPDMVWNRRSYSPNDYILRFKNSTNPGRLYVFSELGIPVVADFVPSHVEMIRDGVSGFLVGSKAGWKYALEKLIKDAALRQTMSNNLRDFVATHYSIEKNFTRLMARIESVCRS